MNDTLLPFGPAAMAVIAGYILSLLAVGWLGYRARREESLSDFYLAGRRFGFLVLLLTLYATQYSGNTLLGFTGKAYRIGYSWVMCVHFMTAVIVFYLLFSPRLHRLSRERGYVTPADYLNDRFGSAGIDIVATVIMVVALANYLLGQLMAMGRTLEGLSGGGDGTIYIYGVIFLALIMVVYETLGGLRAVAWTDAIQGLMLLVGFALLLWLVFEEFGGPGEATRKILEAEPDKAAKALPPPPERVREWWSYIFVVGLGGALYPQAIQRIYAAGSPKVLRRSLAVMAFLPLTTTFIAVLVGVTALAHIPGLEGTETDQVLAVVLRRVQEASAFGYWLVVLVFAAVLAAIMSTADSALLSISSMVTKDIYARFFNPNASEKLLTRIGKWSSWGLIGSLVLLAIALREHATIVGLMDRKFDLLVQLVPGFMIAIHWRGMRAGPVFWGLVAGTAVAVGLAAFGYGRLWGIHPGLYGLALNLAVAAGGSFLAERRTAGRPAGVRST